MKSRQLNKMYQMMRVSRFYNKHKAQITAPAAKKIIKTYNDKMDDLLVYALKQREDTKYGSRERNEVQDELIKAILYATNLGGIYFLESGKLIEYYHVRFSYTRLKSLGLINFETRCTVIMDIIKKNAVEIKEYGVKEKDIERIEELYKLFNKKRGTRSMLRLSKITYTKRVHEHLDALNKMQREKLDMIANSLFESQTIKSQYRKARKYIKHKHPQGMFDEMLTWYGGVKKRKANKKQVLRNVVKAEAETHRGTTVMEQMVIP